MASNINKTTRHRVVLGWTAIVVLLSLVFPLWISSRVVPVYEHEHEHEAVEAPGERQAAGVAGGILATTSTRNATTSPNNQHPLNPNININININKTKNEKNVMVSVLIDLRAGWKDFSYSFFMEWNGLERFGDLHYDRQWVEFSIEPDRLRQAQAPCLLVSNPKGLEDFRQRYAPHCYTLIINDEMCKYTVNHTGDARFYYRDKTVPTAVEHPQPMQPQQTQPQLYVPLGPRYDFWNEFVQLNLSNAMLPSSQRPYIFNAIFSKSTSPSRKLLKFQLNASRHIQENPQSYFIQIAGKWRRKMHPNFHVNSSRYATLLATSQFTLSPTGHNPECFRLYEAMEAGSIPVVVLDDEYTNHACPNALLPLLLEDATTTSTTTITESANASPFLVVLPNWTALEATLQRLRADPVALDRRQANLQTWYHDFMRRNVVLLEDLLMTPKVLQVLTRPPPGGG